MKLDGTALTESDGLVPLTFDGIGNHILEATITYDNETATKSWSITGAPVSLRVLDTKFPEVKMGTDISGRLYVATYTDYNNSTIESIKIYDYVDGTTTDTLANIGDNVRLFFFSDELKPMAYSVSGNILYEGAVTKLIFMRMIFQIRSYIIYCISTHFVTAHSQSERY